MYLFNPSKIGHSTFAALIANTFIALAPAQAIEPDSDWGSVVEEARGQTVYFNAWGGSDRINEYLQWSAAALESECGVTLNHVKVGNISEVVGQPEAAKSVGKNDGGNIDLMWVNGENFAAMKRKSLTWGPFAAHLEHSDKVQDSPSNVKSGGRHNARSISL